MFRHGSSIRTRVACDEDVWREVCKRHVVSSSRKDLDEGDLLQSGIFLGRDFSWEVPREEYSSMLQRLFTLLGWYLLEKGERGLASQNLKKQLFLLRRGVEGDNDVLLVHLFSYLRGGCWFNLGEVALSKLLDCLHDVDECQSFLRQAILDSWRNLEEGLPLHKADLFQHLEPLRQCLGTDIAHGLQEFAKAFRAREERVDDDERPHIAKQTQGSANRMGGARF